jgi:hypothetical protein
LSLHFSSISFYNAINHIPEKAFIVAQQAMGTGGLGAIICGRGLSVAIEVKLVYMAIAASARASRRHIAWQYACDVVQAKRSAFEVEAPQARPLIKLDA